MNPGTFMTLSIDEKLDYGYYLTDGESRVLLHKTEITEPIEGKDEVEVYLVVDHEDRLAATMKKPKITEDHYDWVEVVSVREDMGAFVDIGLSKDALVANDILPAFLEVWPEEGDMLYCSLKVTKNGRFFTKLATEDVMQENIVPADRAANNQSVTGRVYRMIIAGSYIITEEGYKGFIHSSQRKREPRLGELVTGRVIDVKEDGTINVSLLPRKHEALDTDAQQLYDYMESRGGAMPYFDKSDPEDIKERFNMSKGAFKRAIGALMKAGKVYQEDGWTYFKKEQ
ncbi:S1 RNA-binding domain-containing protein [Metabacillus idriensis]|uniref:CvfB family protein n=1 Tax=Metabacillus idriensis TaxID=324768 RepID=UPI00174C0106|nr:S1 RNA-binding domain-containing protein [Metabacillus idriensis]